MELPSILPILKNIPLFADLTEADHQAIIKNIVMNYFPTGYVFFKQNDPGDAGMFIVKRGIVKISRSEPDGSEKEVAVLSDNNFFGEMALVLREPRNATATAVSECEVFQLTKDDFIKLMETSPTMSQKISEEFIARVKKNNLSSNYSI